MSLFHLKAMGLILLAAATPAVSHAAITYDTIALTGDAAPGTGAGVYFGSIGVALLNDAGQTVFMGLLTGAGVDFTNDTGIFSESGGIPRLVARTYDAAPGIGAGLKFGIIKRPVLNNAGQIAFIGTLFGTGVDGTNDEGIFSESGGTLGLVAREGAAAPGTGAGVNFDGGFRTSFGSTRLNDLGQAAFTSVLTGTGVDDTNDTGIFSGSGGTLGLVAREGSAAPGTAAGVNFSGFNSFSIFDGPVLNGLGQTAFASVLTGTGVDATNSTGIFSESGGTLGLVTRAGDAAPGTGPGVNFSDFNTPVLNNAGQTAFTGTLTGTGVDATNSTGIFSESGGTLGLVARAGAAAPGTAAGVNFGSFKFSSPVLNNAGQTAFLGVLTGMGVDGTNDAGIFLESGGILGLVAREGSAAPGTAAGVKFRRFDNFGGLVQLNDAGQIAFLGLLTGSGVDATNDRGIFATDLDGLLQLIAREGDQFDINPDPLIVEYRTIHNFAFVGGTGGGDGRPSSFNNAGQLAFRLSFTDFSEGIFVATVPEPASVLLLGLGGLTFLSRRRH